MGYSKAQSRSVKNAVLAGDEQISQTLSSTNTTELIEFTGPTNRVSMQSSGNLAFTYDVSLNGTNFTGSPVSVAANAIVTYSANALGVVKLTWVSGTGNVTLLAS